MSPQRRNVGELPAESWKLDITPDGQLLDMQPVNKTRNGVFRRYQHLSDFPELLLDLRKLSPKLLGRIAQRHFGVVENVSTARSPNCHQALGLKYAHGRLGGVLCYAVLICEPPVGRKSSSGRQMPALDVRTNGRRKPAARVDFLVAHP